MLNGRRLRKLEILERFRDASFQRHFFICPGYKPRDALPLSCGGDWLAFQVIKNLSPEGRWEDMLVTL